MSCAGGSPVVPAGPISRVTVELDSCQRADQRRTGGGSLVVMTLGSSDRPLSEVYDLAMLDLDGVVYVGPDAVPGAVESLDCCADCGYVTGLHHQQRVSNGFRGGCAPSGARLPEVGDADVVTSAQAVAHLVADALPAGSAVLLVGGEGLRRRFGGAWTSLCDLALDDGPLAVVQGFHPDVSWVQLAEASYAIESGIPWFASNTDLTIPTARGVAPGNGSLVQAIPTQPVQTRRLPASPRPPCSARRSNDSAASVR